MTEGSKILEQTDSLIRQVWQKYQEYLLPEESELSPHQVYFINFLQQRQSCTPSQIAQQFGITLGAVTGFVDRLEKLGLISRTRSVDDRRLVLIKLTDEGQQRLHGFARLRAERFDKLSEKLGIDTIKQLNHNLRLLKDYLAEFCDER